DQIELLIKPELACTTGIMNREQTKEINDSLDRMVGEEGWKEIGVFNSLTRTVGRVSGRVFVGKTLRECTK
ncbi:hypothetical protein FB451DRAFT_1045421, partial [Mycena latifolia]